MKRYDIVNGEKAIEHPNGHWVYYSTDVEPLEKEVEHLRAYQQQMNDILKENERLKAHMRNVAGWLNNGCEPAHGAAELLLIAGLPPPQPDNP